MEPQEEQASKLNLKARRTGRISIVFLFLLALTWSIDGFFFWLFLGAATFFGFLSFYYRPKPVQQTQPEEPWQRQDTSNAASSALPRVGKKALTLLPIMIGMAIITIVIRIIASSSNEVASTPENLTIESDESQAVPADPNDIDALTNTGNDFYAANQYDSAMKYYERVLTIDPSNQYSLYNKALVYATKKDFTLSIRVIRNCLNQYPEYGYAYYLLGDNYHSLNRLDSAFICFEKAYQYEVRDADMLQLWGEMHTQRGNTSKTIELYKEALGQDSSKTELYNKLTELEPSNADQYRKMAERWRKSK